MIERFSLHYRQSEWVLGAGGERSNPDDEQTVPTERAILTHVSAELDRWEQTFPAARSEAAPVLAPRFSVELSSSPGWVCLTVTHPSIDESDQITLMRQVAAIINDLTRRN
ncbi:hypothetical protein ACHIPZ_01605 [Antrihabitans sp. NCIMB 15449]|uniref:Condensation domain-containing protein n=1 Tax=Antrihabitans spumae TaxID=3373370 RepID=A0ABW7JG30_9NOCA